MTMAVKAEDRIKVKGYTYEKKALNDFLEKQADDCSIHVIYAVKNRIRIVEKELKILLA
jgi:hypothetical protein